MGTNFDFIQHMLYTSYKPLSNLHTRHRRLLYKTPSTLYTRHHRASYNKTSLKLRCARLSLSRFTEKLPLSRPHTFPPQNFSRNPSKFSPNIDVPTLLCKFTAFRSPSKKRPEENFPNQYCRLAVWLNGKC